ncbi:MAG: glycosyltransferase family 2 protein [Patescibacteria group bacterium]
MIKRLLNHFSEYTQYRILEILPGAMVWTTFFLAIVLSFVRPIWAIFFIIVFDFYWLFRIVYMLFYMIHSFRKYRQTIKIDWRQQVESKPGWNEYYHAVFYPTYKEPVEVLRGSLTALTKNNFPLDRFIVVLAGEEKDRVNFTNIADRLREEFGKTFFRFLVTIHPAGVVGEMPGKGSNIAWAGHRVQDLVDKLGISYEKVIVSAFDADTCVHPQYFSYLTHTYMSHPNPTHASYQPLAVFNNNVWESPALTRVISYSTTFWLMTEQVRPERLFTFSSHSMSFRALVDVGFWQSDIVTEDSRICLQCIMHYDGDYEVVPLHLPVSMDVVVGHTFWETVKSQYVQQRRWAYGVENFPYMVWNFGRNKTMPFVQKFRYIFNQGEGVYSWATAPILIFILGHMPIWLANYQGSTSVVTQNAPHILNWLMNLAMIGLLAQAILSTQLLPPRPANYPKWKLIFMVFQWVFIPFTLILFGSVPATEAQTRLMIGKYLGFQVTKKVRK